jgi:cell division cycle protein 37
LSLEEEIIDATTEKGKQQLKEIEAAASVDKKEEYGDPE